MSQRRAARFAAIQALYQVDLSGRPAGEVVAEFKEHRLADLFEPFGLDQSPPPVDRNWFAVVVDGTVERISELDAALSACLTKGWTLDRGGYLLRATLRAGAYEIAHRPDVPTRVIINEYLELTHGFFGGDEPSFVNAVLDRLASQLRTKEPA